MRSTADLRELWAPACNVPLITRLIAPGVRITSHTQVAEAVRALAAVCQTHQYALRPEDTGAYNCRQITGGTSYSLHSYGIALDLNWLSNPYRRDRLVTDMPHALVDGILAIHTKNGLPVWRWGGNWDGDPTTEHSAYDAMHYEVIASPDEIAHGIDWHTVSTPARDPLAPATYPVLQLGDRGPIVMELQRRLLTGDDGIFGPATESAVVLYQQARGLTSDGVVGLQTWTALLTQQPKLSTGAPSPVKAPPTVPPPDLRDVLPPPERRSWFDTMLAYLTREARTWFSTMLN